MRRVLFLLMLFVMALSFVACDKGANEDEIRVGILRPEIYAGEMIEKAILMAVEEVNEQGGISW